MSEAPRAEFIELPAWPRPVPPVAAAGNNTALMFYPEGQRRVFVYGKPVDMRKSFDGLSALTKNALQEDPLSGSLFVFINHRRTQIKVLYFDRSGYCVCVCVCVWSKRLERGRFAHSNAALKCPLSVMQLKLLLEGIELQNIRQNKISVFHWKKCMRELHYGHDIKRTDARFLCRSSRRSGVTFPSAVAGRVQRASKWLRSTARA